jgi:hypothetical protein
MENGSTTRPTWQKILIIILIVVGLLITVRFGMRAARSLGILRHRPFPPPMETDVELIRGWMTIPYIAHVYSVPDELLWESLGVLPMKPDEARRTDLSHLNQQLFPGQPMEVMGRVKQAILDFQSHLPPPPPGVTPPPTRTPAS